MWAAWYAYMQNDVLATGIMSFLMHEFIYFGRSLPWVIIDRIPYFNKYKIQNVCQLLCVGEGPCTDNATAKDPHCPRTVELRKAGPFVPLHC